MSRCPRRRIIRVRSRLVGCTHEQGGEKAAAVIGRILEASPRYGPATRLLDALAFVKDDEDPSPVLGNLNDHVAGR